MFEGAFRQKLIGLCENPATRAVPRSAEFPCRWFPEQVYEPDSGWPFTKAGAWEFVVESLRRECRINILRMRKPPGSYACVLKVPGGKRKIYIKIQVYGGIALGRSFHYDEEWSPTGG